ncbi:uncharacterized protein LOC125044818 [Penaeus chinensis]|uniref:uncharacterized protein LOC125044818 n=1 Tax=Penaeus chinensis TaxID=139456 RepID=UPI001FB5FDB0|nr:uncharacterized protein LOC125044818 [Penaeus chinensis]
MSLHRSSSTSSFSSSSSTLLLHPLDIHFLAEPYGPPPPPGPAQPEPFQMGPPEGPPPAIVSSPAYITTSFSARILEGQSSPVGGAAEDVGDPAVGGLAQYKAMSLSTSPAMPAMPTSLPTTPTSQVPMKTSNLPKVQVCGRAGVWWALNAGVLLLYRDMHARGQCSCVRAEVVPLHKVPGPLQAAMVLEQEDFSETHALLPVFAGFHNNIRKFLEVIYRYDHENCIICITKVVDLATIDNYSFLAIFNNNLDFEQFEVSDHLIKSFLIVSEDQVDVLVVLDGSLGKYSDDEDSFNALRISDIRLIVRYCEHSSVSGSFGRAMNTDSIICFLDIIWEVLDEINAFSPKALSISMSTPSGPALFPDLICF